MENLVVRKAEIDDIPHIVKLIKTLPPTSRPITKTIPLLLNKNLNVTETIITNQVKSDELTLYVAVENNIIVGAVYLNHTTNYIGHFHNHAKDIHVQQALLLHVIEEAKKRTISSLLVKTHAKSTPLIKLLTANGFVSLTDGPVEDDTIFFSLQLIPYKLAAVELIPETNKVPLLV